MQMPEPDRAVIGRRAAIAADLARLLPADAVIEHEDERRVYESDGLTAYRQPPLVACCRRPRRRSPRSCATATAQASRWCRAAPAPRSRAARCRWRTASCSASASSTAFWRSTTTTAAPSCSRASPISRSPTRSQRDGFYYAPDPSSQIACSIGGNVAENSGGVHCLKYGLTTNNLLGLEMVLIDGEIMRLGGKHLDAAGYDLMGTPDRLRGAARRRHRSDRAHPAQAGDRARAAGRLCQQRSGGRVRRRHHRGRHHSRPAWR